MRSSWIRCLQRILFESYAFNMKATVENEKLQGKINDEDKQKILDKCNEIINWLIRTRLQRRKNLNISRRSWKKSATPSLPSCTRVQEACLGACQEECLGPWWWSSSIRWCLLLGPPLKRLIGFRGLA